MTDVLAYAGAFLFALFCLSLVRGSARPPLPPPSPPLDLSEARRRRELRRRAS